MATMQTRLPAGSRLEGNSSSPALVMGIAVFVLALPSAVLAYSSKLEAALPGLGINQSVLKQSGGGFAPAQTDPHLTRALASRSGGPPLFRYTPAGLSARPDRSVTVAVRVDEATAHAIVVRGPAIRSPAYSAPTPPVLHLASTAYNLGLAHGYQGFTPASANFTLPKDLPKDIARDSRRGAEMPDLSAYTQADNSAAATVSRLAPHVQLDDKERAGRAPRTLETLGEQSVDVGGSYRVSRNFDVTAGVRYSQDRDRIKSMSPDGKSDSQAVYVGTQFRF